MRHMRPTSPSNHDQPPVPFKHGDVGDDRGGFQRYSEFRKPLPQCMFPQHVQVVVETHDVPPFGYHNDNAFADGIGGFWLGGSAASSGASSAGRSAFLASGSCGIVDVIVTVPSQHPTRGQGYWIPSRRDPHSPSH